MARVVQAHAECLPFEDKSFDASMAVLSVHHWQDKAAGCSELRRVTRGSIVLLTFDPSFRGAWLTDYLPGLIDLDESQMQAYADSIAN
jgi:ubiquinone/menaquinone biosynthesis C-methylase UbiE